MTSRTNRTWRSCEDEKVGWKVGIVIGALVVIAFTFASFANAQDSQPIYQYEQTYAVPQTLYQEYRQTITVTPSRQYTVPQYGVVPQYGPPPRRRPCARGVLFFGPFPVGYYW